MKIRKLDVPNYPILSVDLSDDHVKLLFKYIRTANKTVHPTMGNQWVNTLKFSGDTVIKRKETFTNDLMELVDENDEFFNDVSRIMENKGNISVNKKPEKYTLFDDAENSEY